MSKKTRETKIYCGIGQVDATVTLMDDKPIEDGVYTSVNQICDGCTNWDRSDLISSIIGSSFEYPQDNINRNYAEFLMYQCISYRYTKKIGPKATSIRSCSPIKP